MTLVKDLEGRIVALADSGQFQAAFLVWLGLRGLQVSEGTRRREGTKTPGNVPASELGQFFTAIYKTSYRAQRQGLGLCPCGP